MEEEVGKQEKRIDKRMEEKEGEEIEVIKKKIKEKSREGRGRRRTEDEEGKENKE